MANGTYSYSQLRQLWLKNGGSRPWSYIMAAIAMAESRGFVGAHHVDANGSIDYGLWQINSVHGYDPNKLVSDPNYNARAAIHIFNNSGPHAWSTYNNGDYKQYLPKNKGGNTTTTNVSGLSDPVPGGKFVRVDQGVDYIASKPVKAIQSGTIVGIGPFAEGEGVASHTQIIEKLDQPVHDSFTGETYYGAYYAEEKPLVKKGQHVKGGQDVMAGGSNELGWLIGPNLRMPPLIGGLGAGTQPTKEGLSYESTVAILGGPGDPGAYAGGSSKAIGSGDSINPVNPISSLADGITGAFSGMFSGFEAFAYQALFVIIGLGLTILGLAIIVYTLMEKVGGGPGNIVGVIQTQQRINQAKDRTAESSRAAQVRESQAAQRIEQNKEAGARAERRLQVSEGNLGRRSERYVVKDKPNQVIRKKAGNPAAGVPRRDRG